MSKERNYRIHVRDYYDGINDDGEVDLEALSQKLGLHHYSDDEVTSLGESRLRAIISERLGQFDEQKHGTAIDQDSKKRIRPVPEHVAEHHNRLVDELYHFLVPPEPPVRRDAPKAPAWKGPKPDDTSRETPGARR